jgi:hypothetical protein
MKTKKPGSPGFLPNVSKGFFINYEKIYSLKVQKHRNEMNSF